MISCISLHFFVPRYKPDFYTIYRALRTLLIVLSQEKEGDINGATIEGE